MSTIGPVATMVAICLIAPACATQGDAMASADTQHRNAPATLKEAKLQAALKLKQTCVRYHTENGYNLWAAGAINAECWRRAKLAMGLL